MNLHKALTVALFLSLMVSSIPNATAALLRGYVKQDKVSAQARALKASACSGEPDTAYGAGIRSNSFPTTYEGLWRCESTVIDSQVDGVSSGQILTSAIRFARSNGNVIADWLQPNWNETQASIETFNDREAQLMRTNYYSGQTDGSTWVARSQDQFKQVDDATMVAESEVDQYIDGLYVGRYRTRSTLSRLTQPEDVSQMTKAMADEN